MSKLDKANVESEKTTVGTPFVGSEPLPIEATSIISDAPVVSTWLHFNVENSPSEDYKPERKKEKEYTLVVVLRSPGNSICLSDEIGFGPDAPVGDSLLEIQPNAKVKVDIATESHILNLNRNSDGRLGSISLDLDASSKDEAIINGLKICSEFLSIISITHNVELDISARFLESNVGKGFAFSFPQTGKIHALDVSKISNPILTPVHIALFSAYREAVNSIDPFQRVISLWRVYETISFLKLKNERELSIRYDAFKFPAVSELFPLEYRCSLPEDFIKPFLGKRYNKLIHDVFRPIYRDASAHLDFNNRSHKHIGDNFYDIERARMASIVFLFIIRDYIKKVFEKSPGFENMVFDT